MTTQDDWIRVRRDNATGIEVVHAHFRGHAYDPQPFHLDEDAARHSLFQGLAASGWHTVAITMRLLVDSMPLADGVIGAGAEISWARPTRPGDALHVKSTILSITPSRSKPDRGIVLVESVTFNQDGDEVQKLTSKVVSFRRK